MFATNNTGGSGNNGDSRTNYGKSRSSKTRSASFILLNFN